MRAYSLFTLFLSSLLTQAPSPALASAEMPGGQPTSIAIVELFTSEGCSSCPPADSLLQQIHLKPASTGQLIVGLSEHVTYWNQLGWSDPFSQQIFTARQEAYASKLSPEGPYTPQMVLNGRDQFVGSDNRALQQALHADARRNHADLKLLSSARQADGIDLRFSLTGSEANTLDVIAVFTDDVDQSNVLHGENAGRSLQHVSVARSLSHIATINGNTEQSVHLSLPEASRHGSGSGHHLVVFAQEPRQGAIVGAFITPL